MLMGQGQDREEKRGLSWSWKRKIVGWNENSEWDWRQQSDIQMKKSDIQSTLKGKQDKPCWLLFFFLCAVQIVS
jgi:hypothetical protein